MIIYKLKENDGLTDSESRIADYLLSQTGGISHLLVYDIAKATYTSKATVTRLWQKLDCASYRDFTQTLEQELHDMARINARLSDEPIRADMRYEELLQIIPALYEEAQLAASMKVNKNTINRAVQRMRHARKIDLYGSGVTQSIANLAEFKFSTLGIECATYSGLNDHSAGRKRRGCGRGRAAEKEV